MSGVSTPEEGQTVGIRMTRVGSQCRITLPDDVITLLAGDNDDLETVYVCYDKEDDIVWLCRESPRWNGQVLSHQTINKANRINLNRIKNNEAISDTYNISAGDFLYLEMFTPPDSSAKPMLIPFSIVYTDQMYQKSRDDSDYRKRQIRFRNL